MTTKTSIFLTGATGAPNFDITALVRSETKGKVLQEKFGVRPLVGSLQDADKITAASENANVVINTADCDDLPSAEAILAGMKARHDKTGEVPVLIHTSGTAMLIDDARGAYRSETIYDDMNLEQVKSIPPSALHRHVDIPIVDADVAGYVRAYIVAPSMIYGAAKNALVDAGVANPFSIAVPGMVRVAIKRGRPMVIGEGKSGWPIVHINDTAEFYIQLFDAISARPDTVGHGEEGLYFLENGESPWSAVARSIGRAMVATGVVSGPEPEPESLTTSEQMAEVCGSEFRGRILGSNCRCKARRARAQVGWKPKFEVDDFNASTEEDFRKVFEAEKK